MLTVTDAMAVFSQGKAFCSGMGLEEQRRGIMLSGKSG